MLIKNSTETLMTPHVETFYDAATSTFTYVVFDREGGQAAVIDPVLDASEYSCRPSAAAG